MLIIWKPIPGRRLQLNLMKRQVCILHIMINCKPVLSLTVVHFTKISVLLTGYPAPRRCHSCVQIRNGEACYTKEHISIQPVSLIKHCNFILHPLILMFLSAFSIVDVFICGGYNGELILADLWKINLQTFQWSKLPAVMPEPAYFHCAAVTPVSTIPFLWISLNFKVAKLPQYSPNSEYKCIHRR